MTQAAVLIEPLTPALSLLEDELGAERLPSGGDAIAPKHWDSALADPLRDFLSRPGKEFRAELVRASWTLGGGAGEPPRELPLIVELLHAGSLIVDDIEDGSISRRGQPALHCRHGLAKALNAGNWLYFWPTSLLERLALEPETELLLHRAVNRALLDSHYGQALDLSVCASELAQSELPGMVALSTRLKTASLFELAATLGAVAAGAGTERRRALARFARELGTSLQMLDDLGGIRSERRRAKGYEDLAHDRPTWPWAWLARDLGAEPFEQTRNLARDVRKRAADPEALLLMMRERTGARAKQELHRRLQAAFEALRTGLGNDPALGELLLEIQRLEASYD
jgi:geranylgeranyl pyrophosphate synthase